MGAGCRRVGGGGVPYVSIGVEERRRRFHNNRAEQTAVVYRIDPFPLRVLGLPLSSDLSFFSGYTVFFQGTEQ